MTSWKDLDERRTPFLSRGMGRTASLERRVEALELICSAAGRVAFVTRLPDDPDPSVTYVIYTES